MDAAEPAHTAADANRALARALRFGPGGRFELQPVPYRLLVDGEPAALGGRALDLLFVLASRPSALFGKDELIRRVWPGLVVEENNLRVQINSLRKVLGDELIVTVPGRGYRFAVPDPEAHEAAGPATAPESTRPRRDPDPLFGRAGDLAQLQTLLVPGACCTLVGPPGVGKTRLARHLAAQCRAEHGEAAVVWVDLTPFTREELLPGIVARALSLTLTGGDPLLALRRQLEARPLLLVLDNAEHLARACAKLLAELGPLPALRVLVTAQVPLGLRGERLHRLGPLTVQSDPEQADDDATALLAHRIAALEPRFERTPAVRRLLARVCEQLDGLPLALEMAAARVPTLGLQGVHDALAQRFALLTRGHRNAEARHVSLREALDWSYQLLRPEEQALLRAVSVFPAGFTLELAVAMAAGLARADANDDSPVADDDPARWDAIDNLSTLVERSLVQVQPAEPDAAAEGRLRYRLLESQRAFALQRLAGQPEEQAAVLRQRARVLAAHLERLNTRLPSAHVEAQAEAPNAAEALTWARRHDLALAPRLSASAMPFLHATVWRQAWGDMLREMRPAMETAEGEALPDKVRACWWTELARAYFVAGEKVQASQAAQRGQAVWRVLGDAAGGGRSALLWVDSLQEPGEELDRAFEALEHWTRLSKRESQTHVGGLLARGRAWACHLRGDHEAEFDARVAEAAVARAMGHERWAESADSNAVLALLSGGRPADALPRAQALLARVEAAGGDDNPNLTWALLCVIRALAELGQGEAALQHTARACAAARRMGTLAPLHLLPLVAQANREWEAVALSAGYVQHTHDAMGQPLSGHDLKVVQRALQAAIAAVGERRVQGLMKEGRLLGSEAVLALFVPRPAVG